MPIVLIFIGVVLLVSAIKNTHHDLAVALETDVPGFAAWFGALALVGGLGYVPGMQQISRWLLALVMVVLVLGNYAKIFAGFKDAFSAPSTAAASQTTPAEAYAANPSNPQISQAEITGSTQTGLGGAAGTATAAQTPAGAAVSWLQQYAPTAVADLALAGFGAVA
jgi:hypothetical protein